MSAGRKEPPKQARQSSEASLWPESSAQVARLLQHPAFDAIIGVVIVLNAVTIGLEQSMSLRGQDATIPWAFEHVFLVIYVVELGLRFFAFKGAALNERWVRFDLFLVTLGIVTTWILEPFVEDPPAALNPLLVLRTTRLLRVGKTMKFFVRVTECWRLVRGFINSSAIIVYTFVVWFLTLYVFSCLGVEIITKHTLNGTDPEFTAVVNRFFRTLPQTMVTLVRFACLDNTGDVYQTLVDKDPWLFIYFGALILIVSVVLFHTLGAVIFSCMLEQNSDEHEAAKAAKERDWEMLVMDLRDMFIRLDADQSGCLSRKEVANISSEDKVRLTEALGVTTPMQVFDALDVDGSGEVSISEFFDGVWECVLARGTLHLKRMEKQVETSHWRLKEMFSAQHDIRCEVAKLVSTVKSLRVEVRAIREATSCTTPPPTPKGAAPSPSKPPSGPKSDERMSSGRSTPTTAASAEELVARLERILEDSLVPTLMQMKSSVGRDASHDPPASGRRAGSFSRTSSPGGGSRQARPATAAAPRPEVGPVLAEALGGPAVRPPSPTMEREPAEVEVPNAPAARSDAVGGTGGGDGAAVGALPPMASLQDAVAAAVDGGRPPMTSVRVQM